MQSTFQILYKTVASRRKKERFETILEPLQAILQIALLAYDELPAPTRSYDVLPSGARRDDSTSASVASTAGAPSSA